MIELPPRPPKRRTESTLTAEIIVALNRLRGVRVARNNSGRSPKPCGVCFPKLCRGCAARLRYPIAFGLGDGSPDVVGILSFGGVESSLEALRDVEALAVPFGVEVKQPGRYAERDQKAWHLVAGRRGLLVRVERDVEAAVAGVVHLRDVEAPRRLRALASRLA